MKELLEAMYPKGGPSHGPAMPDGDRSRSKSRLRGARKGNPKRGDGAVGNKALAVADKQRAQVP